MSIQIVPTKLNRYGLNLFVNKLSNYEMYLRRGIISCTDKSLLYSFAGTKIYLDIRLGQEVLVFKEFEKEEVIILPKDGTKFNLPVQYHLHNLIPKLEKEDIGHISEGIDSVIKGYLIYDPRMRFSIPNLIAGEQLVNIPLPPSTDVFSLGLKIEKHFSLRKSKRKTIAFIEINYGLYLFDSFSIVLNEKENSFKNTIAHRLQKGIKSCL